MSDHRPTSSTYPYQHDPAYQCQRAIRLPHGDPDSPDPRPETTYYCRRTVHDGGIHDAFCDHSDEKPVRW